MDIQIRMERENITKTISFSGKTVQELLTELAVNPEAVIVVRQGEVLTEKESLHDQDTVELLSVISGG
ncbi:MAG: MoaD/ThiS family protein [Nanoarchaeota archaeon]